MGYAPADMRDRTAEFAAAAERVRKQLGAAPGPSSAAAAGAAAAPVAPSEFARSAARIGHAIHATSGKLAKLAQLAKRTGMFDDPAQEIAELTAVVKQDITTLNTAIAELQQSTRKGADNKHSVDHNATVVDNLKSRLMSATKEFKDVLTLRQENIKVHNSRRSLFSATADSTSAKEDAFGGGPSPFRAGAGGNGTGLFNRGAGGARGSLQLSGKGGLPTHHAGGAQQQQQQQLALVPAQDQYLQSRQEALQNVEHTIAELGGIFQQLATMVAEQGELAIRIDENMEESLQNVENAQTHLVKYLDTISSNRWLIMKIFAVLVVFLLVFVVFVA